MGARKSRTITHQTAKSRSAHHARLYHQRRRNLPSHSSFPSAFPSPTFCPRLFVIACFLFEIWTSLTVRIEPIDCLKSLEDLHIQAISHRRVVLPEDSENGYDGPRKGIFLPVWGNDEQNRYLQSVMVSAEQKTDLALSSPAPEYESTSVHV